MDIVRGDNREVVQQKAAEHLNSLLAQNRDKDILLLLSGGSSLGLLPLITIENLGEHVTITMLDERYSEDVGVNNFAQMASTDFYHQAREVGCAFIDTRVRQGEPMEALAERFDAGLKAWRNAHNDGIIIATVGVGPDGHTSGIMPFPEDRETFIDLFDNPEYWAVGYDAKDKNEFPLRVTVTLPFLRMVSHALTYMVGEGKRDALRRVLQEEGTLWGTPARVLREMKNVTIFTDIQ